jgi:hypothetical protein
LRPASSTNVASFNTGNSAPLWFITNPNSGGLIYAYDAAGSVFTISGSTVTGIGDLSGGGGSAGNGSAYYDNYIYFSTNTTIARYGPFYNGSPSFTNDYWVGTLGKTPLENNVLPAPGDIYNAYFYPNHVMCRHSDGKLYIADVVGDQGTLHYIATTKTSLEGDTDNGSTYNKIQVGYGLYPTAIESYGSNLVIAFLERGNSTYNGYSSKIAFWDTTSQNINSISWVEFPDQFVTSIKNVNGVLYLFSASNYQGGFRLSKYIGGNSFTNIFYSAGGFSPHAGAVISKGNNLYFGNATKIPLKSGCVYKYDTEKNTLFNVMAVQQGGSSPQVSALSAGNSSGYNRIDLIAGGAAAAGSVNNLFLQKNVYGEGQGYSYWWSQLYRIGQPFKIKKIRIPLAQAITANMSITAKVYTDDGAGTTYTLATINNTNDSGLFNIIRRSGSTGEVMTGKHNFWIELNWTGSVLCTVGLPITMEYELLNDDGG